MFSREYYEYAEEENFRFSLKYIFHKEPINKRFLRLLRKAKFCKIRLLKWFFERKCVSFGQKYGIEVFPNTIIGKGLYLGHPYAITVNPNSVLGEHVCLHKGVTVGVENRGGLKGTPTIGNCVWIGINSMIYGRVKIGSDVLISPNTLVNFDVPDHSVVYGNPAKIKHRFYAVEGYINQKTFERYFGDVYEIRNND